MQHVPFKIISFGSGINMIQESKQSKNNCLSGFVEMIFCFQQKASAAVNEPTVTIDSLEAVEGALNDSWDQIDNKPAIR